MPNIRIDDESYNLLKAYKDVSGVPIQRALKQAIDQFFGKKAEKPKK